MGMPGQDPDSTSNNSSNSPHPPLNEYYSAALIDQLLDRLRNGILLDFFEDHQKWLVTAGLYGLYLSALLGIIACFYFPAEYSSVKWGPAVMTGLSWSGLCLVTHYLAVKFIPGMGAIIQNTPSSLASTAFLDALAVLFMIAGVGSLVGCVFTALSEDSLNILLAGMFAFVFCEYIVSLCLKPKRLNIGIDAHCSAGQEFLGITSFVIKVGMKLTPIIFGSGVLFGILHIFGMFGSNYEHVKQIRADLFAGLPYLLASLSPVIAYIAFLSYYIVIDVVAAILSLNKK